MTQKFLLGRQLYKLRNNTKFKTTIKDLAGCSTGKFGYLLEQIEINSYLFNDDFINEKENSICLSDIQGISVQLRELAKVINSYADEIDNAIEKMGD